MKHDSPIIYTDGASLGNPGPGGWGAVALFPAVGEQGQETVVERGGGAAQTTNNRMELTAAIEGLRVVTQYEAVYTRVQLYSDSRYTISGITAWVHNWVKQGWQTQAGKAVQNKDLWEELYAQTQQTSLSIDWQYVPGHVGVPGNERADTIASAFAKQAPPHLYEGSYDTYPHGDLKQKTQTTPRSESPFYISCVDGVGAQHRTWPSCKRRVAGVRGAQFKKVHSQEEARAYFDVWGCR